jgi:hypothetical protein
MSYHCMYTWCSSNNNNDDSDNNNNNNNNNNNTIVILRAKQDVLYSHPVRGDMAACAGVSETLTLTFHRLLHTVADLIMYLPAASPAQVDTALTSLV